jgi:ABC-type transporter MlaC component
MRCKAYGTTANPLNVHHFTYERLGNEWNSDLGTFCQRCHLRVHGNKYHYYQEKTRYWEIAKIRSRVHWDKPIRLKWRYIVKARRNGFWRVYDLDEDKVVFLVESTEKAFDVAKRLNSGRLGIAARARLGL